MSFLDFLTKSIFVKNIPLFIERVGNSEIKGSVNSVKVRIMIDWKLDNAPLIKKSIINIPIDYVGQYIRR